MAPFGKATCLCSHSWLSFPESFCLCVPGAGGRFHGRGKLEWPKDACCLVTFLWLFPWWLLQAELSPGQPRNSWVLKNTELMLSAHKLSQLWPNMDHDFAEFWTIFIWVTSLLGVTVCQRQKEVNSPESVCCWFARRLFLRKRKFCCPHSGSWRHSIVRGPETS